MKPLSALREKASFTHDMGGTVSEQGSPGGSMAQSTQAHFGALQLSGIWRPGGAALVWEQFLQLPGEVQDAIWGSLDALTLEQFSPSCLGLHMKGLYCPEPSVEALEESPG